MASNTMRVKLDAYLIQSGKITLEQLSEAKEHQKGAKRPLQDVLVEMGFVTEDDIFKWMQVFTRIPVVNLANAGVDPDAAKLLNYKFTISNGVLPYKKDNGELFVAMSNPLDVSIIDEVTRQTGMAVRTHLARASDIKGAIEKVNEVDDSIYDVLKNIMVDEDEISFVNSEDAETDEYGGGLEAGSSSNPIIRLVNLILSESVRMKSSDVHIEPTERILYVKFRVDGMLRTIMRLPMALSTRVVARLKIMSGLDIAEKRIPQDGRAFIATRGKKFDLRVSTLPMIYGEKVVIRLLDKTSNIIGLDNLNLLPVERERLESIISRPYGVFLVVGPTGSGKSTTLYSVLQKINTEDNNTITVEDPVEYNLAGINQVQVNVKAGLTFPKALRSILRQDPDVIMIGEIRDGETAEIAIKASITGHLVMSTLHTNDAPSAVTRLIDIGVDRFLIASSLLGVIAQRLVRKLCPDCKRVHKPDDKILSRIMDILPYKPGQAFYEPVGCEKCGFSGYRGRMAVFEILMIDQDLREMILEGRNDRALLHRAVKNGMDTLYMAGLRRVYSGFTSLAELSRVIEVSEVEVLLCPNCNTSVEYEFFNCPACGYKLGFHCCKCATPIKRQWHFCKQCGNELPRKVTQVAEPPTDECDKKALGEPEKIERPLLLIVDDDKMIRKVTRTTLKDKFATIIEAENGADGLMFARKHLPDMMLLDVMMPGMTGFEVCAQLRASLETSQIPIMLLTAISEEEGRKEGLDVGADDYLTKPFSPPRLRARVDLLIRRKLTMLSLTSAETPS